MPNTKNPWYALYHDVNGPNPNSGREPCLSYRPYVMLDGRHVVYVLNVDKVRQTAGKGWKGIERKLNSGEIPWAKLATVIDRQALKGVNIQTLPEELTDIVRSALAPKA